MSAAVLLDRLDKVRQVGPGRWLARCPAHDDKTPSLSIREMDDGRVLLYDFAGCGAPDVLAAVGLTLADLFPAPLVQHGSKPARHNHWHAAREALRVLNTEALIVAIGAGTMAAGDELSADDRERLMVAAARIREAAEVVR